ncbi:SusD/RagB family nutrient-binding outer membrane lipoprotein [Membranihabitans marinus]|uniref:SusD/RagB family nutrient-binding outer membrane lipoprotein n=1 Tax=Membranihabitans marinus TaxID=1227546 RepID=UPI001F2C2212|nr:SusD/RagB family nutrient-binding outer membrane lipoprotein [Membranihabitans marinus]
MKNHIVFLIIFFGIGISCSRDFESINQNPNASESIDPQFLLSNVISVLADENTYNQGFRLASYLAQFSASVEFERIDRYELGSNATYWNLLYHLLADIESMQTVEASNEAYEAVGDILKSYIYSQLTDLWGDVPYTEALKVGVGITTPQYDRQEDIYLDDENGLLAILNRAASTLSSTTARIQGDVMYGNDLDQWIRLANALQVRYYLRISNKIDDFSVLEDLANSAPLMRGNGDNAVVPYLGAAPNQFPLSQAGLGIYQEHRMTRTVDSILHSWDDPRMAILYKPTAASISAKNPQYKGLLNGQNRETIAANQIDLNDISLFGSIYRDVADGVDGQIMLYSELQFALAEAVERGLIDGDVEEYYVNGITAHFEYLGADIPEDYFTRENIALNGEQHLDKILTQKWLSLISNGHEAWFNVRRTGIPHLKPGPDNLNGGRYPARYLYPESEQAVNQANYQAAIQRMGPDNINTKVWWMTE